MARFTGCCVAAKATKLLLLVLLIILFSTSSTTISFVEAKTCSKACDGNTKCGTGSNAFFLKINATFQDQTCNQEASAFCPNVDTFSALKMTQQLAKSEVASCSGLMNLTVSTNLGNNPLFLDSIVYAQNVASCISSTNSLGRAYATYLLFNVTLNSGAFWSVFTDATNITRRVGTGFVPTCNAQAQCSLDPNAPCIGGSDGSGRNGYCATCISSIKPPSTNQADVDAWRSAMDPTIFIAYYGTDSNGINMVSGNRNPFLYQQWSFGTALNLFKNFQKNLPTISIPFFN